MEAREEINVADNLKGIMILLSEGNPGAINVLFGMLQENGDNCFISFLDLDDMNIRGSQIWVGFKDHCEENLDKFIECITKRDIDMVNVINLAFMKGDHKAVTHGGSSSRKVL